MKKLSKCVCGWMLACLMASSAVYAGNDGSGKNPAPRPAAAAAPVVGRPVDLGLTVLWASHNVGASKAEEAGGLYGWADPTGAKRSVDANDYPAAEPSYDLCEDGFDIARKQWGGTWRLPSRDELEELIEKCRWTPITYKDVEGMAVTGPNGNSIFLPAAGGRCGSEVAAGGQYGYYWSQNPNGEYSNSAHALTFGKGTPEMIVAGRYYGLSVRPVMEGE